MENERLRRVVMAYADGSMEKVAKIVRLTKTITEMLQQTGWAHTITCLEMSSGILEEFDGIEGYKSFIEYLKEDTYRVGRN